MHVHVPAMSNLIALLVACGLLCGFVYADDEWMEGRATFYDDNTEGSCRYGTNIPTFYAAWPDSQAGFPACGQCYEVSCVNRNFRDGYGKTIQRTGACRDESATVTVKIVDSCPCIHENFFSNQRWCCGDMRHIDLGRAAFGKLADEHHGVVGAKWRKVPCPESEASAPPALPPAKPEPEPEPPAEPAAAPKPAPKKPKKKSTSEKDNNNDFFGGKWRIRWPKWFDDL